MGSGLRGVTLRFAHEVRSEMDYFSDIPELKLPAEMMKLAQLRRTRMADIALAKFAMTRPCSSLMQARSHAGCGCPSI
jgi:non-homologous end joining protein Ku